MPEILSKRELEEITKCERVEVCKHDYVPCEYCGIEIARTALTYREMLEEVIKHLSHCPFCKINRPWLYKHKDGCKLAALLKESEVEEG